MQYQKNISLDIQQHRNGLIDYKKMLDNFQLELYKKIEQCENENCIKKLATYYEELIDLKRHFEQVKKHKKQLVKWHNKVQKDKQHFFMLKRKYETNFGKTLN